MNKSFILGVVIMVPVLFACGRFEDQSAQADKQFIDPVLVAMADGTMVDRNCLRGVAKKVESEGRGAASSCIVGNAATKTNADGRGFHNDSYPSWWSSYYIFPPYYYGGNNYNNFCSYYGFSYNYNCYGDYFGYDYNNYYSNYNSSCDSCLWNNPNNNERCYWRCYRNNGWVGIY